MQTGYPCPYCGFTDHPEDANYCGNCGKVIKFTRWFRHHLDKHVNLSDLMSDEAVYLRKLDQLLQDPKFAGEDKIFIPFDNPTDINTEYFKVLESTDLWNLENECKYLSNQNKLQQNKILEALTFIREDISKSGRIFGGKSKSEILNELDKILS